ncbi:GTP-binding protein Di-Ras2 [Hydra vulgaris]|uniref:GTP-binding protein Di-Ras2 n=1 Tax=Hydra vulgaris TaxID=6087 RepID=UPI001F5F89DC|nr:GTP-binding protein Di-Ras2-like [Hydra vulgaris]
METSVHQSNCRNTSYSKVVKKKSESKFFFAVAKKSGIVAPQTFSVAFYGDKNVGKTSILRRAITGCYQKIYVPTVLDIFQIEVQSRDCSKSHLTVYDTSGLHPFPAMMPVVLSKCDACVVVFSLTSEKTLFFAEHKLSEIQKIKGNSFPCILVGNQSDSKNREVIFEKALRLAVKYSCSYLEVSAELNKNVVELFSVVIKKIDKYDRHFKNLNEFHKKYFQRMSDLTML